MTHAATGRTIVAAACWILASACGAASESNAPEEIDAPAQVVVDAAPAPTADARVIDAAPASAPDGAVSVATCNKCHGDESSAAPPRDLDGVTATTAPGVGAHRAHGGSSSWHKAIRCEDCHRVPASPAYDPAFPAHMNGVVELTFNGYDPQSFTCAGVACHGAALLPDRAGQSSVRTPKWTQVDGSQSACGAGCHTLPPGGAHASNTACASCHAQVIASIVGTTVTWARPELHIDGVVEASGGSSCTACHGTDPGQINPPRGVAGETSTGTLAVGRHVAHLTASATHQAVACDSCHVVPADFEAHTQGYVASGSLAEAGHHGDVTLRGPAAGMTWSVDATQGAPVVARGTCTGACHSNGRGGAPRVVPYWAGGAWTSGGCDSCHAASPTTGHHGGDHSGLGLTCASCHPAASAATHVDGKRDVLATIAGAITVTPPGGPCGTRVTCNGSCHGETHSNRCW